MPLSSGIQQPFFDSILGVKRQTKIEGVSVPPNGFPSLTLSECSPNWVTFTAGSGVKGAYSQLLASTVRETKWLGFVFRNAQATTNVSYQIDFAIGPAASEVPFWEDSYLQWQGPVGGAGNCTAFIYGAHAIPIGSRVSVRAQDGSGGKTIVVLGHFWA